MSFLIDQIKFQKVIEMEIDVDSFIAEKGITEEMMIFQMKFSKDVFTNEKEVREYLKDKYVYSPEITEIENEFIVGLLPLNQIDIDESIEIELRRGVLAQASNLLPVLRYEEMRFNDKGEVNFSSKFDSINLNENMPYVIEIARVAEGEHPSYGKLSITQQDLETMVENFKSKVTGVDLAVNEDHQKNEAFGWFKDVFLSYDKQTLYGQIKWNNKGIQALSEKEYRYFSPEFRFNYKHPHTGKEHGATLLGGALTNYPFLKMDAITELNNKKEGVKNVSTINLTDHHAKVVELSEVIRTKESVIESKEKEVVELNDKLKAANEKLLKIESEATNKKLFDSGKINAAQLIALNEGKNFLEVLALSGSMNTEAKGTSTTSTSDVVELSAKEKEIAEKLGLTAEEFLKFN